MTTLRYMSYVVLLLLAFGIGLVGTIAASRAVISMMEHRPAAREQPAQSPQMTYPRAPVPTQQC